MVSTKNLLRLAVALAAFSQASLTCLAASPVAPAAATPTAQPPAEPVLNWYDVSTWGVEGRAFADMPRARWFDRLPASAEGKVTDNVWNLSRDSAGMMVRFKSDASRIWADYALMDEKLAGSNMTAIGASGLDLYARDDRSHV